MSLGEGQIISRVGDPFSANIALAGAFDKDIKFHHVKGSECRSSMIGQTAGGCDYVYEGKLAFLVKKKPDGQFFLQLEGERSDDLFYHIIIRYQSPSTGTFYKAFDFLPEFKSSIDTLPAASDNNDITTSAPPPSEKYGVLMGNVIEVPVEGEGKHEPPKPAKNIVGHKERIPVDSGVANFKAVDKTKRPNNNAETKIKPVSQAKQQLNKPATPELKIKKEGSSADEIFALQKENEVIEQQITLLEKQIALLRELAKLRTQADAPPASATAAAIAASAVHAPASSPVAAQAPAQAPARAPVKIPVKVAPQPADSGFDLLNWALIAAALLLVTVLVFLYIRKKKLYHGYNPTEFKSAIASPAASPAPDNDENSLDLTGHK